MTQPRITLSDGTTTIELDPDLQWKDEFEWAVVEQTAERGLTGAHIVHVGIRQGGRPITLASPDESSAWMLRAVLDQLRIWEAQPLLKLTLNLRGENYTVALRRYDGAPIEAEPVMFVANPLPGEMGDFYIVTLRFYEVQA